MELDPREAIEAAAAGIWDGTPIPPDYPFGEASEGEIEFCRVIARAALGAAAPILERQVREKIAAEIEAYNATLTAGDDVFQDEGKAYLDTAAALARGRGQTGEDNTEEGTAK